MRTKPKVRSTGSARGDAGRAAILEAAIIEFAEHGFEGARTRSIAQRAGQNLASLHYHFGSKDQLYLALADTMVASFRDRLGPYLEKVIKVVEKPDLSATEASRIFIQLIDTLFDAIVADERTMPMSRIIVREQMGPTAAFEIFNHGILDPVHTTLTRLFAIILERNPNEPQVIAQAHALFGQVFVFRAARATILHRTGWRGIHEAEAKVIREGLRANLSALFQGISQTENRASAS